MKYEQIICTCCMGLGAHEYYNPTADVWTQEPCGVCESKGYITPECSDKLWDEAGLEPKKQETPHRG